MRSLQLHARRASSLVALVAAFLIAFNRLDDRLRGARLAGRRAARRRARRAATVWWELVKEALVLGAVGVALGLPLGILVGRIALPFIAETTAHQHEARRARGRARASRCRRSLIAAMLGMVAALLAALLPAWRAARLEVVQTLPHARRRAADAAQTRVGWIVRAVVVVGARSLTLARADATGRGALGLVATALIAVGTALAAGRSSQLVERPRRLGAPRARRCRPDASPPPSSRGTRAAPR